MVPSPCPWCHGALVRSRQIPLARTSFELVVRRVGKAPERTIPSPSPGRHAATRFDREISSSSLSIVNRFGTGTLCPAFRAYPFPEVTNPFFRLSLPTLFYRPEDIYIEDLMRLRVQSGVGDIRSFGFLSTTWSTPDTTQLAVLFQPLDPTSLTEPIPGWAGY
ncbi:hypothetical protein BC332_14959 [Capsicum chinense]|nr:hypothetical protein BC332_14959 [Capsicum chinense]